MNVTRRNFIKWSGLAAAYLTVPTWLSGCTCATNPQQHVLADPATWQPALSLSPDIDAICHMLNRISYGARPNDVQRIQAIGLDAFLEQ